MPENATLGVLESGAAESAAIAAWRSLAGNSAHVAGIETLKETSKTAVYRMLGVSPGGASVIAKRRRNDAIDYERHIYENVLSVLPVSAPRYFGWCRAGDGKSWIFLEDSGGAELDYQSPVHMTAATKWLATMHVAASPRVDAFRLADRGPFHYLRHLTSAAETLGRHMANPALTDDDVRVLTDVLRLLDRLGDNWETVEAFCATLPATFTHGDFVQKNVHVREGSRGIVILPFDWETSGWGISAPDLPRVDIDLYWSIVRDAWPASRADASRMVSLGTMFRLLAAISWEAPSFRASWVKRASMKMALYRDRLATSMETWAP